MRFLNKNRQIIVFAIVVIIAAIGWSAFAGEKKITAYAAYDSETETCSYDEPSKTRYVNNAVKITFDDPLSIFGPETVEEYAGAKFFRDPADDKSGYLVFPSQYSLDGLVDINDRLLNEYGYLSYAGVIERD